MRAVSEANLTVITGCRSCGAGPLRQVLSLGHTPLANALLTADDAEARRYPLDLARCGACGLVQLQQVVSPEALFSEYVYFSSTSETMLRHAEALAQQLIRAEQLGPDSLVVELASNDGYLLQYFKRSGVPVLGIEPAANIARVAEATLGIPTLVAFFDQACAQDLVRHGRRADVIIGNNVLAHVPDLNGFVAGVATLLVPQGVAVFEVPYLRDMLERVEFDTIYHEHQCYFSLTALQQVFGRHGLEVVDVERIAMHGGSLRVSAAQRGHRQPSSRVASLLAAEAGWQVLDDAPYTLFAGSVDRLTRELKRVVDDLKHDGARLVAYGAAAKGVTLTSACGIGRQQLDYVVDRSPHKAGKRFPVGGLPIYAPERLCQDRPDYALLLTWNFAEEIVRQQACFVERGGQFIVPVPWPTLVGRQAGPEPGASLASGQP